VTIILMLWWSLARGNHLVPSRWQATPRPHLLLMVSRTDDAFPHISPRGLAVAASFNAPYSAVTCGLRVRRFAIGREVHVADLGSVLLVAGARVLGSGCGLVLGRSR
jgi:hypothetical protein